MDRPDCRERNLSPAASVGPIAKDVLFEPPSILELKAVSAAHVDAGGDILVRDSQPSYR